MAIVERPDSQQEQREPRGDGVPTVLRADYESHLNDPAVRERYERVMARRDADGPAPRFQELNPSS